MSPRVRKLALAAHVASSVGWLGAVGGFLALAVAGLTSDDGQLVRGAYLAMDVTVRFAIVPLALASVLTGVIQGLGTPWGLFRHYWVVVKLVVTIAATLVLLSQLEPIRYLADTAARTTLASGTLRAERTSLVAHAGGGLAVLMVPMVLSIYKPRGRTRYGRRKHREASASPPAAGRQERERRDQQPEDGPHRPGGKRAMALLFPDSRPRMRSE
jgi:hypothetical protein